MAMSKFLPKILLALSLPLALPVSPALSFPVESVPERDYYKRPFADSSPWNRELASYAFSSGQMQPAVFDPPAHIHINSNTWSIPFYLAENSDPPRSIYLRKLNDSISVPFPKGSVPAPGTDAHLSIMTPDQATIYEFFRFDLPNRANTFKAIDARGSGVAEKSGQNIGSRAYGGSSVGGLIRRWELESGSIDHALAIALSTNYLKPGFVPPATSEDTHSAQWYSGSIPMGSLFTLASEIDEKDLPEGRLARLIVKALQEYGAYVVDSGGDDAILFYAEPGMDKDMLLESARELNAIIPYLRLIRREDQGSSEK